MSRYVSSDNVWWSYMSGPSRLVEEAANTLLSGKSLCLCVNNNLPYVDTFFRLVAETMRETEDMILEDTLENVDNPGIHLIDKFNRHSDYRGNISHANFLLQQRVLAGRLFPVIMEEGSSRKCVEFVRSYNSSSIAEGLFLLIGKKQKGLRTTRNLRILQYSDFVTEYDSLIFAGLIGGGTGRTTETSRYITALAVSIFGMDAEGIECFAKKYEIGEEPGQFIPPEQFSVEILNRRIWEAQLQELFPLIMKRTRELIDTWRPRFEDVFEYINVSREYPNNKFRNGLKNTHGVVITTPEEMEINTIRHLMGERQLDCLGSAIAEYVLFLPSEEARKIVDLLCDSRNRLAHGKVCPAGDVEKLLSLMVTHMDN